MMPAYSPPLPVALQIHNLLGRLAFLGFVVRVLVLRSTIMAFRGNTAALGTLQQNRGALY